MSRNMSYLQRQALHTEHLLVKAIPLLDHLLQEKESWKKSLPSTSLVGGHVYTNQNLTHTWKKQGSRIVLTLMSWVGGRGMPKSFLYWHLWPVTFLQFL